MTSLAAPFPGHKSLQKQAPDAPCAPGEEIPVLLRSWRGAPGSPGRGLERRGRRTKPPPPSWGQRARQRPALFPPFPLQGQPSPTSPPPPHWRPDFQWSRALDWRRWAATPRATPHGSRWGGSPGPTGLPFSHTPTPSRTCQLQPPHLPAQTLPDCPQSDPPRVGILGAAQVPLTCRTPALASFPGPARVRRAQSWGPGQGGIPATPPVTARRAEQLCPLSPPGQDWDGGPGALQPRLGREGSPARLT